MAIDALGHVIVGGARFAQNGDRILTAAQIAAQHSELLNPAFQTAMAAAGANAGHVVVGNGLLSPELRHLVQMATLSGNVIQPMSFHEAQLLSTNVPHASTLVRRMSNPCLMEHNQNERDQMDRLRERNERDWDRLRRTGNEALLMAGCARAGDIEGALEHGIQTGLGLAEPYVEATQGLWQATKNFFGWGD
jgi:hypothetical protein